MIHSMPMMDTHGVSNSLRQRRCLLTASVFLIQHDFVSYHNSSDGRYAEWMIAAALS